MIDPLAPFMQYFSHKYQSIELIFTSSTSYSVSRQLNEGKLDFAFERHEALVRGDEIEWKYTSRYPLCVVLSEEHPFAKKKKVTVDMLAHETIILISREYNPGFFDVVSHMFHQKGITPLLNTTPNDRMSILLMVQIGKGVTILSKQYMTIHKYHAVQAVPIDDENAYFDSGMAWNKTSTNPCAKLFLEEISAYLENHAL
jgi:DNA-binding transcriptional LysR family regulator